MIPKIAHFYWGGSILPYLRYMSLWSFRKYNPDWMIILHHPADYIGSSRHTWDTHEQKYPLQGRDYFDEAKALGLKLAQRPIEPWHVSHCADLCRLDVLSTIGGLWSDMDIIYFDQLDLDLSKDTYICRNDKYGHSVGFLLASPGNKWFTRMRGSVSHGFDQSNYQSIGSILLNRFNKELAEDDPGSLNMSMELVYAYDAITFPEIYQSPPTFPLRFTEHSIGLHWYAGHPMAEPFVNGITEDNFRDYDNVLGHVLRRAQYLKWRFII